MGAIDHGFRFEGRTVLLTGGSVGIGRAFAARAAAEGAQVVVTDLHPDQAEQTARALPGPGQHTALALDVTDDESVRQAIGRVVRQYGHLDVLVNVAGGDTDHPEFEATDDDVWRQMLDLNLLGAVRTCRAAVPQLRRTGRSPAIVNVSSVNGLTALGSEPYSAAKAALGSMTANLAASLGPDGIRVNAVAPGTIRTRVWDAQPGGADRLRGLYPLGRVGEPADVASAIAFLASDDAAWITGQMLPVDGGLLTGPGRTLG